MNFPASLLIRTVLVLLLANASSSVAQAGLWSTAYYPGYRQAYLPPARIDFTAVSHVIHFSVMPQAGGGISVANGLTPAYAADLVTHAHAAGSKALICVGGADSQAGFQAATTSANRAAFITNVVHFMTTYGYDGVDLDWEPLDAADAQQFTNLVTELRIALDQFTPRRLLTVATASRPAWFAALQSQFDQINLMTYDMAGPWPGWVTWFNSPIYDGGFRFPSTSGLVPSMNGMVDSFITAGIAPGKLGVGIPFYGYLWAGGAGTSTGGASLPRQTWGIAPNVTAVAYFDIMATYYQTNLYRWDTNAQAAYLGMDHAGATNDKFLSYDDEHACQAKVSFARNRGLGGVMIWELGQGYRSTQPIGLRDPLLQSVKQALAPPRLTAIQRTNEDIVLSCTSLPLALYRVQWRSDLASGAWLTLTNNLPGTGGILEVADPGAATNQSPRFYRVQTPP
jgi:chitinase